MYSSTLSSPSALDGGWVVNATAQPLYPQGKTRYPWYRRLGGPQGRSEQVRKISPPPGFDPPERPARSESLHRLSYPGPQPRAGQYIKNRRKCSTNMHGTNQNSRKHQNPETSAKQEQIFVLHHVEIPSLGFKRCQIRHTAL